MSGPLHGIRVLETATLLPGPYAGLALAELGADVIKVEPPGGDPARHYPPHRGDTGSFFLLLNRGKKSVVLDLKSPAGHAAFLELVRTADVVLDNWRPAVAKRLGATYADLSAANPRVIACSITGWGSVGPRAELPGHDVNYQAWAGTVALTGSPASGPAIPAVQIADLAGGALQALVAILAALRERETSGRGRHLDVAMAVGTVPLGMTNLAVADAGIRVPGPGDGALTGGFANYRLYPTKQGHLAVGCLEPKFWIAFCNAIGLPELAGDAFALGDRAAEVVRRVEERLATATAEEWERRLAGKDTCVERLRGPEEILADPWLREIGALGTTTDPEGRPLTWMHPLPAWPEPVELGPAPALGEHDAELLGGGT